MFNFIEVFLELLTTFNDLQCFKRNSVYLRHGSAKWREKRTYESSIRMMLFSAKYLLKTNPFGVRIQHLCLNIARSSKNMLYSLYLARNCRFFKGSILVHLPILLVVCKFRTRFFWTLSRVR